MPVRGHPSLGGQGSTLFNRDTKNHAVIALLRDEDTSLG